MKWLAAGLVFVASTTVCAVILGIAGGGLRPFIAVWSVVMGILFAFATYVSSADPAPAPDVSRGRYHSLWFWGLSSVFAIFALRCFCWLLYIDGPELKIQSPNNLGDLALHITYIREFASGTPLWPDNPIFVASKIRYPAGTDVFNAVLSVLNVDLIRGLVWAGLLGSLATFYALWRWGGEFAIGGFLFNGGTLGFNFLRTWQFDDYQGKAAVAWKSIPLTMFVTQRGWLYAIPVGLLLLWHWREKYSGGGGASPDGRDISGIDDPGYRLPPIVELGLYASLPLFHVHTFLAMSAVLVCLFVCGDSAMRKHVAILIGMAFLPATFFVWLVSDNFNAGSMLEFKPGWVLNDATMARASAIDFWFSNFGIWFPLLLVLLGICVLRLWKADVKWNEKMPVEIAFLLPATGLFLAGMLFKFAPWEWDNLKLMVWGYFLVLPFLWTRLIRILPLPVRAAVCVTLFGSGFVTLFGGMGAGRPGFGFASRGEVAAVGAAVRTLPLNTRFATFPTYNHPLLLQGRKVVMGYPGHLWTQGFKAGKVEAGLTDLMNGKPDWQDIAHALGVRYIFWGHEEQQNYRDSKRPWESTARMVAAGDWGSIYDLESLEPNAPRSLGTKLPTRNDEARMTDDESNEN